MALGISLNLMSVSVLIYGLVGVSFLLGIIFGYLLGWRGTGIKIETRTKEK